MRLSLYEFQSIVKESLQFCFPEKYWVTAEFSDLRVAANGHCYLELLDKDGRSQEIVAKSRAMIWSRSYAQIARKFEEGTGGRLESGQRVLVQVGVSMHELFGYSLVIHDIDPTYTVGEAVRRRQEILARLEREGFLRRNGAHVLRSVPRRVAVVSSESAAGYEDFVDQLQKSSYLFQVKLFGAVMQGSGVDESMIRAMRKIEAVCDQFDVVVVIRGGGSSSDLSCFDSYVVAREIALFPLPVIVGIGHERDETVLDSVGHTRVKTPTAAAEFLIGCMAQTERRLEQLEQTVVSYVNERLVQEKRQQERFYFSLKTSVQKMLDLYSREVVSLKMRVESGSFRQIDRERHRLSQYYGVLFHSVAKRLVEDRHRLDRFQQTLELLSPDELLRKGYSMTVLEGRLVTSVTQVKEGDRISSYFIDGKVESVLERVECYELKQ